MKKINDVVVVPAEARAPVNRPLDNVSGYAGEEESQLTRHDNANVLDCSWLTKIGV
jgi:hypothetical protein